MSNVPHWHERGGKPCYKKECYSEVDLNRVQCRICKVELSVDNLSLEIQDRVRRLNEIAELADVAFRTCGLLEVVKDHLLMHANAG
jgi:hypothetical protein